MKFLNLLVAPALLFASASFAWPSLPDCHDLGTCPGRIPTCHDLGTCGGGGTVFTGGPQKLIIAHLTNKSRKWTVNFSAQCYGRNGGSSWTSYSLKPDHWINITCSPGTKVVVSFTKVNGQGQTQYTVASQTSNPNQNFRDIPGGIDLYHE